MLENCHWIALLPLVSSAVILFGSRENTDKSRLPLLGVSVMGACLAWSAALLSRILSGSLEVPYYRTVPWFSFGDFSMTIGVLIDGPAAFMLVVVTLVSFLVQVYSLGYMRGDPRFKRYYAFLSFFTASMLGLVISSNLMVLFACWELVGLSSYLLIGFWFEREAPAYAAKKAFITTKLGDLGFYLGLMLLFSYAGTFDLRMLAYRVSLGPQFMPPHAAAAVGLLLLCGAAGKSAQVPLFIWLPDAMEGPTPVSALIHAATMVAAGVYLVARTYFLFAAAPIALEVVAWTGLATAALAATMAVTAFDIKRVLAFSTVSQLGFMMLALGVGGFTSGLFHLTTHACFKALLFLAAGSVIHAVHTNDMRQMGGLSKKMPETFLTMLIGTLAIAGMPGLSGWFSKEAILHDVFLHSPPMWALAAATAALTSFYMFRLLFLAFSGPSRDHLRWDHAHESPASMTIPLWTLAVLSVAAGFLLEHTGCFERIVRFATASQAQAEAAPHWLGWAAFGAFIAGLAGAWRLYGGEDLSAAGRLRESLGPLVRVLEERWGFDRLFLSLVAASDALARAVFWFDDRIVDGIFVDGWGLLTRAFSEINRFFDDVFVDGAVNGVGTLTQDAGLVLSRLMRGLSQEYLLYAALCVSLFTTFLIVR
jgi:NADH-quinone oxidoreductase subunit L